VTMEHYMMSQNKLHDVEEEELYDYDEMSEEQKDIHENGSEKSMGEKIC